MARITPLHLLPAFIAAASHAAEVTIETRPFSIEKSFNATVLPEGGAVLLKQEPEQWATFEISAISAHGTKVSKGEILASFENEDIDKKLVDAKRALESGTLSLAQAEQDSKLLQETAPNKLEASRRAAEIAKEENAYFTKTRRKAREESAGQSLKRSEQILANQQEELKQLTKMYEADDLTEDTEEIILIRQRDAVASAEFALRMEILDHKRTLEVTLPREAKTLADAERDTGIALKKAEAEIPRSLELNKISLEAQRLAFQRAKEDLAKLEADRKLFEHKAPADGWFYHGPIENGRWLPAEMAKVLVPHGLVPVNKVFATFVPGDAKHSLISFLDEATARSLAVEAAGSATFSGREDLEIPVKLSKLAGIPGADGTYRADFSMTIPENFMVPVGATAQVRVISYKSDAAIVLPNKALRSDGPVWTVDVKLADGKTEKREVKRGRVSKDETEIVSGLEPGQVIVVPS